MIASAKASSASIDLGVARQPRRQRVERAHLGARAVGEDLHQPDVVDVLVGDDDPLEVLDAPSVLGQRRLQRGQRRGRVRAGVDQRERVVLDQVAVDAPHGERRRDGEDVDGPAPLTPARARRGAAHGLVVGRPAARPSACAGAGGRGRRSVTLIHDASMVDHQRRPVAAAVASRRGAARRAGSSRARAWRRCEGRRPSAASVAGSSRSSRPSGSRSSSATSDSRPARALEHRRGQRAAPAEGRQRLGDRRHRRLGHVQAAVGGRVVVPGGALVLAGEPQRAARGVARGRRVDRQHPPDDHAKLPAASASIASSSSRVFPPRMRSTGRRSRRCGLTPSSQSSAASGE